MDNVRADMRLAGLTSRYHTWPHVHNQSVGEHSWQLLRILMNIAPHRLTVPLMCHLVMHDVGEHHTGDIPYPVKRENKSLKEQMDILERYAVADMALYWSADYETMSPSISEEDARLHKLCEFIEMWEWGLHELNLGNRYAQPVIDRCHAAALGLRAEIGRTDFETASNTVRYMTSREELMR